MKYLYLCMSILLILSGCEADDKIIIDKPKENTVFVFIKNSHSFEDLWEIYMSLPYYGTDRYRRFISPLYMQIGKEAPDTVFFHYPEDTVSCISVDLSPFHCPQDTVYYDWN